MSRLKHGIRVHLAMGIIATWSFAIRLASTVVAVFLSVRAVSKFGPLWLAPGSFPAHLGPG
jgi:hypothetical protein